jgi:O-antigen ligase
MIISFTLILAASDALFQFIQGHSITGQASWEGRLTSFLRRPDIGIYLAKLIFPLVALWIRFDRSVDHKKTFWFSGLFLFFIMTIVFLTGERAATTLSFCALIFSLFVILINHKEFRGYIIGSMLSATGGFCLILYMVPFIYKRLLDLINDIVDFPHSLYGQLFKASILSWYQYGFFTGVGIHQFRNSCLLLKQEGLVTYCNLHSHNIYFEILSESGLVGLCLLIAFVFLCLWKVVFSLFSERTDFRNFVSSILVFSGFFVILFPFSVTMSFISNWSAILNWVGLSLCFSVLALPPYKK